MMGYRFPPETMDRLLAGGRILFGETEQKLIELKVYAKDYRAKLSSIYELDGRVGTNEIKDMFPDDKRPFDFPKPTELIEELLSFTTTGNDLVLDAFAGSGTTGHALMKLNHADGQNRRFLLVEMKSRIARQITRVRLSRVAEGYENSKGESVAGLGGGFRFATLGEPLFDERGNIRNTVRFPDLARHVFFVETGEPMGARASRPASPLLGIHHGTAVYLLYNGILKDKAPDGGNVLTTPVLAALPSHDGPKVIYGTACRLGPERLRREGIVFKQLPYKLRVDAP